MRDTSTGMNGPPRTSGAAHDTLGGEAYQAYGRRYVVRATHPGQPYAHPAVLREVRTVADAGCGAWPLPRATG